MQTSSSDSDDAPVALPAPEATACMSVKKVKAVARKAAIAAKRSERSLLKARDDGILNAMMALSEEPMEVIMNMHDFTHL